MAEETSPTNLVLLKGRVRDAKRHVKEAKLAFKEAKKAYRRAKKHADGAEDEQPVEVATVRAAVQKVPMVHKGSVKKVRARKATPRDLSREVSQAPV